MKRGKNSKLFSKTLTRALLLLIFTHSIIRLNLWTFQFPNLFLTAPKKIFKYTLCNCEVKLLQRLQLSWPDIRKRINDDNFVSTMAVIWLWIKYFWFVDIGNNFLGNHMSDDSMEIWSWLVKFWKVIDFRSQYKHCDVFPSLLFRSLSV